MKPLHSTANPFVGTQGAPLNSSSVPAADPQREDPPQARWGAGNRWGWRTGTAHRAISVAAWTAVLALLLCGSFTGARAQLVSDPNQIVGTIGWNNPPGGLLYPYLTTAGFSASSVVAVQSGGGFSANLTIYPANQNDITMPYLITVQADQLGISYDMTVYVGFTSGDYCIFAPATSPPVFKEPAPDVTQDFFECAGLIEVQFCDAAGDPVIVSSGQLSADILPLVPGALSQAHGATFANVSSRRLFVRGGNTFSFDASIDMISGTDPFVDRITLRYSNNYTVTVGCDEIVTVKFIVPPAPIGSGGGDGTLGKIIGIADVLGKSEHWIDHQRTLLSAFDGPLGNDRYNSIEPLSQSGYSPCSVASLQVGTLSCNSAGPYSLINLLPSGFATPPRDYVLAADFIFDLNRRFEHFTSPSLGVAVPTGTIVDLEDTFVIDPGYVVGDIFICGPDEGANADSCLRYIDRASDYDSNGDGIPDDADMTYSSYLFASGIDLLGAGATLTARGGRAAVNFEGDFVAAGPNKNHFVGDYSMALGGLKQETTLWNPAYLNLVFRNTATPAIRDSYIVSGVGIYNYSFENVPIVPSKTVTLNHRYGFSKVIISFHATSGKLFGPSLNVYDLNFNGINFEGQQAQYQGGVGFAYGTPTTLADADTTGQIVLCVPEGNYTFYASVLSVNPDGVSYTHNTLPPFSFPVGPCELVRTTPGLVLNVDPIPECVAQPELDLSGSVSSDAGVASITYTLNGNTVTVPNSGGANPSFNFSISLEECENTLQITATDLTGGVSSRSKTILFDGTPPVLFGCEDRTVDIEPGELGALVDFNVSATDNCADVPVVTCSPPSGSLFFEGETPVTCQATDQCGNVSECTFTVTVTAVDRTPPTIECPGAMLSATDPGQCSAVVTFTATASDNRPGATFDCSPASGSAFSTGPTTVVCTATDAAGNTADCSFTVTVEDREAPTAQCMPTTNPSGNQIPTAGKNPKSGQNPDGFYQLLATDNCDAAASLQIFVKDSFEGPCGGAFTAGPYQPGDKVKLTQSPGQNSVKPMAGVVIAHINTRGDPVLVVTDSSGNTTLCQSCLVPPKPK